jgi:peptidyl-prolyl cis-trans isomerase SurA
MFRKLILTFVVFNFIVASIAQSSKDPSIISIKGSDITKSEFERVYRKNNVKETSFDRKSVTDYLNLYVNYKLKVREAFDMGMDTAKAFTDELVGYRKQLAAPYLTDKDVSETLLKEAYKRMQTDIRASHILVKLAPDALPKDTIEAYSKVMKIREELTKGADFATVAKQKSDDPSAKDNGGDLGYFSALQMVYTFESAAYNTKLGEISMPVRTRFGYHLIKVTDSRAAQGEVKVAHIMAKFATGGKADDSTKAITKINTVYDKLKAGGNFEDLVKEYSEDQGTAKSGGVLPMFGTGRMVPEFEKAAFALKNVGDYSAPTRTSYGWHIIKLLEKKPMPSYDEMQADLKTKIGKDSRSELGKTSMINKIKAKNNFKEMPKAKEEFMKTIDSTLTAGKWTADKAEKLKSTMFTLGTKNYTQKDFAKYVADHQSKRGSTNPQVMANNFYNEWVNESVMAYEESMLEVNYPEFKALMEEYRDGILLFELTDKKVWSKAVKDTVGLKDFYEKNKSNYMWPDRVEATIYTCANAEVAKKVRQLMKTVDDQDTLLARANKDNALNLQIKKGKFAKGDNETLDSIGWNKGMTKDFNKNGSVVFVDVKQKLPAQPKTLEEAKGLITADYQQYLEKDWIETLKKTYPVVVHQEVVETVIKK